jgi:carbohydrate diacid regulator
VPGRTHGQPDRGDGFATAAESQVDELAADLADRAYALARAATRAARMPHDLRLGLAEQYEARDRFIYDLLVTRDGEDADLFRRAEIMAMDLGRPRAVILVDRGPRAGRDLAEGVIRKVVQFFHLPSDTICGYIGDGEVAILKASSTADLEPWARPTDLSAPGVGSWANLAALKRAAAELAVFLNLQRDSGGSLNVAVGRYHSGLRGLGLSYRDAYTALSLGRRYLPGRSVYALDELGLGAWVGPVDEDTRTDLAYRLVAPIAGCPELLDTLDAFFAENGSPLAAASRLSIHRNTLSYRLDRIHRLTGLDPHRFDDAVQLRLAMLLRRRACADAQDPHAAHRLPLGT